MLIPPLFLLLPPRTWEPFVPEPAPSAGRLVVGAAIRAGALLALSLWLHAVMRPSE